MQVAALASGASDYPQWDFNMPDIGAGSYSVWMLCEVDSRSQIPESNESNLYKSNGYFTATDSVSTGEIRGSKWNDLDGDGTVGRQASRGWPTGGSTSTRTRTASGTPASPRN